MEQKKGKGAKLKHVMKNRKKSELFQKNNTSFEMPPISLQLSAKAKPDMIQYHSKLIKLIVGNVRFG